MIPNTCFHMLCRTYQHQLQSENDERIREKRICFSHHLKSIWRYRSTSYVIFSFCLAPVKFPSGFCLLPSVSFQLVIAKRQNENFPFHMMKFIVYIQLTMKALNLFIFHRRERTTNKNLLLLCCVNIRNSSIKAKTINHRIYL